MVAVLVTAVAGAVAGVVGLAWVDAKAHEAWLSRNE